jgi:hypothetical protein
MPTFPSIHLNGTSKAALLEEQINVLEALRAAREAMSIAQPNGRDYYPQGPMALLHAQDANRDRFRRLNSIIDEVEKIVTHISDQ